MDANPPLERILGRPLSDLRRCSFVELVTPHDLETFLQAVASLTDHPEVAFDCGARHISGRPRQLRFGMRRLASGALQLVGRDVTVEHELRRQVAELSHRVDLATSVAGAGSWSWDLVTGRFELDAKAASLIGIGPRELTGTIADLIDQLQPEARQELTTAARAALRDGTVDLEVTLQDGETLAFSGRATEHDRRGRPTHATGIIWTAAIEAAAGRGLLDAVVTDHLTGVANRRAFDRQLQAHWRRAVAADTHLALVLIDVDDFKRINDDDGHLAGDLALINITRAIQRCLRSGHDLIARWGGDEFALLLPGANEHLGQQIATRAIRAVRDLHLTISAGVAARDRSMISSEVLLPAADRALYAAKQSGKDRAGRDAAPHHIDLTRLPTSGPE